VEVLRETLLEAHGHRVAVRWWGSPCCLIWLMQPSASRRWRCSGCSSRPAIGC